jgi:hypothetical protein
MRRLISGTVAPSDLSSLIFCTTSSVSNGLGPNSPFQSVVLFGLQDP